MANYILFEKKSENERPPWDMDTVKNFCEEQEIPFKGIVEESMFFVVKIADHDENQKFRLLELTPTITFLLKDDPSLDEFMEAEIPERKIEVIDEKEDFPVSSPVLKREQTVESP